MRAVCGRTLQPRHATYLPFVDARGNVIDHGLALYFPAPNSYTGEEVLELQGHGGPVVMQMLLSRCLEAGKDIGLRVAEPGEFTRRAFLNDKLDLAQAEAVADLIEASTEAAARRRRGPWRASSRRRSTRWWKRSSTCECWWKPRWTFPKEIDFLEASNARGQLTRIRESRGRPQAGAAGLIAARRIVGGAGRTAQCGQVLAAQCARRFGSGHRHADRRHHA
jgi:tRNA modification GTPase